MADYVPLYVTASSLADLGDVEQIVNENIKRIQEALKTKVRADLNTPIKSVTFAGGRFTGLASVEDTDACTLAKLQEIMV